MKVSLFITCLIDQFFPEVGVSTVRLLRKLGVDVDFPEAQTCCGQPAFNSGYQSEARDLAKRFISIFETSEYVVAPSGSCTSMVRVFYPELLKDDGEWLKRAEALASRTYEFTQFVVNVLGIHDVGVSGEGKVALHQSCHLLRELKVKTEPQALLAAVKGIELVELERADQCCGFGGLFSIKYPDISGGILEDKIESIEKSGADVVVACDVGCLMHIGGGLSRASCHARTMHIAELLGKNET
ncbi:MAG TPA: (Fe-S)-binding protein [Blastocatellia bacterium]|nr:(Fe-S)-binding protein [Blastocatellia bacterium]